MTSVRVRRQTDPSDRQVVDNPNALICERNAQTARDTPGDRPRNLLQAKTPGIAVIVAGSVDRGHFAIAGEQAPSGGGLPS